MSNFNDPRRHVFVWHLSGSSSRETNTFVSLSPGSNFERIFDGLKSFSFDICKFCVLQARPMDYASGYLAIQEPVSFHKFWMMDPEKVYNQWFKKADESLRTVIRHEEL